MNTQIMELLTRVSAYGEQHLAEIECDLTQIDALQDEAIKKLCASFIAIHQAVNLQQQTLSSMLLSGSSLAEYATLVEATQRDVSRHAGEAVAGLQFQDMTSQLIGRMVLHLSRLRDAISALDIGNGSLSEETEETHNKLPDRLNALRDAVAAHCAEMSDCLRSTVNQRHMNSGEVELF